MFSVKYVNNDDTYSYHLEGTFKIHRTLDLTRTEIESLRKIGKNLDDENYKYTSRDGVISYEKGKLVLYLEFKNTSNDCYLGSDELHIENIKAFIDGLPNLP